MKRAGIVLLIPLVLIAASAQGQQTNANNVTNTQSQNSTAIGGGSADSQSTAIVGDNTANAQGGASVSYSNSISEGGTGLGWSTATSEGGTGVAWSDGDSAAVVDIDTTSISNYKSRVPPMTTYPPYLPLWNHGGWGTINAYFPNGPTANDSVYQRSYDPSNPADMRELKGILKSMPYKGPLNALGGVLNGVGVLFGGPNNFHHGRGVGIASSLIRSRRPAGKPLLVVIDTTVDPQLLRDAGYAYVGRISLEGEPDRNWDHVYNAAVAEALPWDVDLLLVSGGMKGVTVGTNVSFPSASLGYSQTDYSLSLFGGHAKGITEGKGEAVLSASAYRYAPQLIQRRKVPDALFEKIRRPLPAASAPAPAAIPAARAAATVPAAPVAQGRPAAPETQTRKSPGIEMSKELYDMAGFSGTVDHVIVK